MDIRTSLSESLWAAIETTYESHNYTGAILDALYHMSNFIREKTGLQSDGVPLIAQAFGGKSPKLRVNLLQTESDWNVQKGTESLLTGLYQSIRNPRSHEKYSDNKEVADSIILFVNYLLGIIGASKGTFSKAEFLNRVFDKSFVQSEEYAQLLVEEIPRRHRFDVMIDVYRKKEEGETNNLALFTKSLLDKFDDAELTRLAEIVSDELKITDSSESVRLSAKMFPAEFWARLDKSSRMRSENRFIESIREGEYVVASNKCIRGALGTWCGSLISNFVMKDQCVSLLLSKLDSSKREEQDYVFQFFSSSLLSNLDKAEDDFLRDWAIGIFTQGLKVGDTRFYNLSKSAINYHSVFWKNSLKEAFDSFQEAGKVPTDESKDIPF